jgi:hypothetical protein
MGSIELEAAVLSVLKDSRTNLASPDIPAFLLFLFLPIVRAREGWRGGR